MLMTKGGTMTRRLASIALAFMLAAGMVSCAPTGDTELWLAEPLSYDSALEEDSSSRTTDVTYILRTITSDAEGGFWSHSSTSWLHIDRAGLTARRYNDFASPSPSHIAAVSPTQLIAAVGPPFHTTPHAAGLYRVDTSTNRWSRMPVESTRVGAITVHDQRIVYVDYTDEYPLSDDRAGMYTIRAVHADGTESVILGPDPSRLAADARLATDASGLLWVATESSTFTVSADGAVEHIASNLGTNPVLAVSPAGSALVTAATSVTTLDDGEWNLSGGSREARSIVERSQGPPLVFIEPGGKAIALPFTANAIAAVWLDDTRFIAVIPGSGDEAVLLRVRIPQTATD